MPAVEPPCPKGWEYEHVTGFDGLLSYRAKATLAKLRSAPSHNKARLARDTRQIHKPFFAELTPEHFPHYAGHYRGEALRCLDVYEVRVPSDPRVGHTAATVQMEMADLSIKMIQMFSHLDLIWSAPATVLSREEKLFRTIELVAGTFVYFLEIHPFANGNGHMARFMIAAVLGRHGLYFKNWPVHPKPADPPYSPAIAQYRSGNRQPLEQFLLACF